MRKIIFICLGFCLFLSNLGAKDLIPNYSLTTSGGVSDLVLKNEHLYVATTASSVDIFDLKTKEKIDSIIIPKIKDFMNESIDARVYSIDIFDNKFFFVLLLSIVFSPIIVFLFLFQFVLKHLGKFLGKGIDPSLILWLIANVAPAASDPVDPVTVVPAMLIPNGSPSSVPLLPSSSGVKGPLQLVPDARLPVAYVTSAGRVSVADMLVAVADPVLVTRMQYRTVAPGIALGLEPLTPSEITELVLTTLRLG